MPDLKSYKAGKGDPKKNPFEDNLPYKLSVDLPLDLEEPITFADFEVFETEHHAFQLQFWLFNKDHRELDWRFATRHFPSVDGKHDVIRVWRIPAEGSKDE